MSWWRDSVCYQVYVRSFADGDGDGLGDLPGIISRLPYLAELGVDALWITPFYPSPQHDAGYDVADFCDVDPRFGTLSDADTLLARAHELGLRVILDVVPNHTSSEHPWFRAALAAGPDSAERERYLFRTGRDHGTQPPNNWASVFGGPAWTRVPDSDQWYLHLFDTTQPDLNWRNPEVPEMFDQVLRFWLDRGVDGFRVDVAHSLVKEESLRDQVFATGEGPGDVINFDDEGNMTAPHVSDEPMWDQPEVHDIYRRWHRILAEYDERMAVAEAWTATQESMARYVRPDELQQTFNFAWLQAPWSAHAFRAVVVQTLDAIEHVHASPTWVLSNHDVKRHVTRYGGGATGLARARAATLAMLALPGSCYLYQGEELGLADVDVPPAYRQDPVWFRAGHPGRDGCRVPLPWSGTAPPYGFGPGTGQPWLPQPADWAGLTVESQRADPHSTWSFYRDALAARRRRLAGAGPEIELLDLGADLLAFQRGGVTVVLNAGRAEVPLAPGEVLCASGDVAATLPPDTAVWLG